MTLSHVSLVVTYKPLEPAGFTMLTVSSDTSPDLWPRVLFAGQLAALPAERVEGVSGEWADQGL